MRSRLHAHTALALLLALVPAFALPGSERTAQTWYAVADGRLAALRGGFAVGDGLLVSFGITRSVRIDGELVASMTLPPTDLRSITPAQAQAIAEQLAQVQWVQSGAGNSLPAAVAAGSGGIVVQNTLPDRQISTVTQIDAVSNGMGLLKQMNIGETLQRGLAAAIPR